jgi:predicted ester cyclase
MLCVIILIMNEEIAYQVQILLDQPLAPAQEKSNLTDLHTPLFELRTAGEGGKVIVCQNMRLIPMYKHVCLLHLAAFPDMRVTTENIIAEDDKVAIRWTVTGTHMGALMGIPATGRKVTWTGITTYRFADDKIVENWWAYDALGMMQQITAPPESEPPQE